MSYELLIIVSVTFAITFVVIVLAVGMVIHKSANARGQRRRRKLYDQYSEIVANILLIDLPPLPPDARASAVFAQYEELLGSLKEGLLSGSRSRQHHHRAALRHVMVDFARDISGETADRLTYFFHSLDYVDEEIERLADRRWWIRAQAASDLGLLRARRAIGPLTAALEDDNADVRLKAMESLVILVGVEALRIILKVSRNLSVWSMVELSNVVMQYKEEAVAYLVEGLDSNEMSVVLFCIEMLAEIGFTSAVEPLRKLAQGYPNVRVRAKAAEALGRLGDGRAELLLLSLLDNAYPLLRMKAIGALGQIGSPGVIPFLVERMLAGDMEEKVAAGRAIAGAGAEGVQCLEAYLSGEDDTLSAVAAQVLEEVQVGREAA